VSLCKPARVELGGTRRWVGEVATAELGRVEPRLVWAWGRLRGMKDSNLVDSASSHTLVSKIKPCMSKYESFTLKLRTAHYISYNLFDSPLLLG